MSEWIDFSIYAASNVVLWIVLPLACRELALPVLVDRNPEWVAANPATVQRFTSSYWFNNTCIGWGFFSILVLLLMQAGALPALGGSIRPLWQRLNSINNALFMIGFVGFGVVMFLAQRRLCREVPRSERRSASLQPRSTADSVSLPWRMATEMLTVVHLCAWVIVGATGRANSPRHWDGFIFLALMSAIFAVMARATAHRPANYMDRIYGPAYRRREVRVLYGVRLAFVAFGALALTSSIVGTDAMPFNTVRGGFLLFQILFMAFLMAFVLIKPVQGTSSCPGAPRNTDAGSSGIALSLLLLIAAPILAVATTSLVAHSPAALATAIIPAECCATSTQSSREPRASGSADLPWVGRWLR